MKAVSLVSLLMLVAVSTPQARGNSNQRIAIRVSPVMAFAPAMLTVRTTIEPNDDNRSLSIEVDSDTYHRGSEITLDGKNAARLSVFDFRGVPSGLYEVRAVLFGPGGPIAKTIQLVRVEPSPGSR